MNPAMIGLDDVQGNILKGHGRTYTVLLFFRFAQREESAEKHRELLRDAARGNRPPLAITTAREQERQTEERRQDPTVEHPFISLALSRHGLKACKYTPSNLGIRTSLNSDQFWYETTPTTVGDSGPWHAAFTMDSDGVFLLAHAVKTQCIAMANAAEAILRSDYGVGSVERQLGFRWTPKANDPVKDEATYEHFGFADGFARTAMVARADSPLRHLLQSKWSFRKQNVEPFKIPIEQVMIETEGVFCGGSFLAISKLEQNVRAFLQAEEYLEKRRAHLPGDVIPSGKAGALFIGRTRDGTPLAMGMTARTDGFDFNQDPVARGCPFMAHIRKMNPRQDRMNGTPHRHADRKQQNGAQFVRRGVLYGDENRVKLEWPDPAEAPDKDVGMLFMGYMSQTRNQFLKMYFNWGPDGAFPQAGSGPDALLGGGGKGWKWPQHPKLTDPENPLTLGQFVTGKGTGFFIVPPLHWLRSIT